MQSNTPAVENQPINFPKYSVEKKPYKADPFTITDGRYVGSDGFVVPKDFEEFYQRFPDYVRNWVSKHADRSDPKENLEDRTQDLLIHLQHLPPTSKYREAGKEDIVATFDPVKHLQRKRSAVPELHQSLPHEQVQKHALEAHERTNYIWIVTARFR